MKILKQLLFLLLLSSSLFAQQTDVGFTLGGTYYMGDLNPSTPFKFTQPAGGLVARYMINPRYCIRGMLLYGTLTADDSQADNLYQRNRNLSFKSALYEASGTLEFNFLPFISGDKRSPYSPYLFIGLSVFGFNPQAEVNGKWYDLKPLGTEGEGLTTTPSIKPYSLVQVAIPFGFGIKFNPIKQICVAAEWGMRKTFTDYIDDVSGNYIDPQDVISEKGAIAGYLSDRSSANKDGNVKRNQIGKQRGNSSSNDWYSYAGLVITYQIPRKGCYKISFDHKY